MDVAEPRFPADSLPLIRSRQEIAARIHDMGSELYRRFAGRQVTAVPVLNGALIFAADLLRAAGNLESIVKPVTLQSYTGKQPGRDVVVDLGTLSRQSVEGRHVLIIDDILDTGRTLGTLIGVVRAFGPASITITVLLQRLGAGGAGRKGDLEVKVDSALIGFEIPGDQFVVGYGLDYNGLYRALPDVRALPNASEE